jgi:hypothetical protein
MMDPQWEAPKKDGEALEPITLVNDLVEQCDVDTYIIVTKKSTLHH